MKLRCRVACPYRRTILDRVLVICAGAIEARYSIQSHDYIRPERASVVLEHAVGATRDSGEQCGSLPRIKRNTWS
jgi:hypothetical protein